MSSSNSDVGIKVPAKAREYSVIQSGFEARGGAQQRAESLTIHPTGLARTNVRGTAMMDRVAVRAGADPLGYVVLFAVDEPNGRIVIYPAAKAEPGSMQVRRYNKMKALSFHMGAVFAAYTNLRPPIAKQCLLEEATDSSGEPCLLVAPGSGLARAKRRSASTPPAEA